MKSSAFINPVSFSPALYILYQLFEEESSVFVDFASLLQETLLLGLSAASKRSPAPRLAHNLLMVFTSFMFTEQVQVRC